MARGPGGVEATGSVVQQCRVLDSAQQPDGGVGLVTGGADRVEPVALPLQPARREIEMAALDLCLEQVEQQIGVDPALRRSGREPAHPLAEVLVDRLGHSSPPATPAGYRRRRWVCP
jgi:hypothetical protein